MKINIDGPGKAVSKRVYFRQADTVPKCQLLTTSPPLENRSRISTFLNLSPLGIQSRMSSFYKSRPLGKPSRKQGFTRFPPLEIPSRMLGFVRFPRLARMLFFAVLYSIPRLDLRS